MHIELDGLKIKDRNSLHKELKEKLDLPDQYGENLDDLWDCLTGWVKLPITLVWNNHQASKDSLEEYFNRVCDVLNGFSEEEEDFSFELD